ncbi:MAG: hypothetical protein AMS18_13005, partial [Gemmatimonas sp. SG8_17]
VHLWFAVAAWLAAANAFVEPLGSGADTVADLNRAFKWAILFQGLCWIALVWYVASYARNVRRWLAVVVSLGFGFALVIHIASPYGVLFSEISGVLRFELPWGELYSLPEGTPASWRILTDATILLLIAYVITALVSLIRTGERRKALRLGGATGFLLAAMLHGSLVDLAILQQPYLMTAGFLFTVLIMGLDLADEAVKASELEREVAAGESRWSLLLEQVSLLVVGLDTVGRVDYVNPFFCETAGFDRNDTIGELFSDLVAFTQRDRADEVLRGVLAGDEVPYTEISLVAKDGSERIVLWSHVAVPT